MARKSEGLEALVPKRDPVSIQELTMLDFFAAFALIGTSAMSSPKEAAKDAFDRAEAALDERARRQGA